MKNERNIGLKNLFEKCAKKYGFMKPFKFNVFDRGSPSKEYSMCYNKNIPAGKEYCGPDWVFYHWPSASIKSFQNTRDDIILESKKKPIICKIGWYGNIHSANKDVIESTTRPLLKKYGDENPDLLDIIHVDGSKINRSCEKYLSLPELTKYEYLIDIGGNGYSGRLKFLLFSNRPLFIVDRCYIEYFYDDLIPYKHYIPVKMDLSDLLEQIKWVQENPQKSLEIANNAFQFAINNFTDDKISERIYYVYNNLQ